MGILLILGVCAAIALLLGVPFGIHAGIKSTAISASGWNVFFGGALKVYLVQAVLLLAVSAFLTVGMESHILNDFSEIVARLRRFVFFSLSTAIIWFPVYSCTFVITRFIVL